MAGQEGTCRRGLVDPSAILDVHGGGACSEDRGPGPACLQHNHDGGVTASSDSFQGQIGATFLHPPLYSGLSAVSRHRFRDGKANRGRQGAREACSNGSRVPGAERRRDGPAGAGRSSPGASGKKGREGQARMSPGGTHGAFSGLGTLRRHIDQRSVSVRLCFLPRPSRVSNAPVCINTASSVMIIMAALTLRLPRNLDLCPHTIPQTISAAVLTGPARNPRSRPPGHDPKGRGAT